MNPNESQHRQRLSKAMEHWYKRLEHFRRSRRSLIEDYAGSMYGERSWMRIRPEVFVNLIHQTVEALTAALAYNDPRFEMQTHIKAHKRFADVFETSLNNYVPVIQLRDTIEGCLRDAFFSLGICKIYLESSHQVMAELDPHMDPGMPWAGRVSLDNWVHDGTATDLRRCLFMGDRYRMPLEDAKDEVRFDAVERDKLTRSDLGMRQDRDTLASDMTQGAGDQTAEVADHVDLIDIYLARERLIVTWPIQENFEIEDTKPLSVQEWDGAETGPYRFLNFVPVPDNTMPSSPAQLLRPLFLLFNNLFKKQAQRARAQKDIPYYLPGSEDDMFRALQAGDLQPVRVNDPQAIDVLKLGGTDQTITAFNYGVLELFKSSAGNLDFLAGLGPSTDTLGQDQMVAQQVNARLALYRNRTARFVSDVGIDLCRLMYDDPLLTIPGSRPVDGARDFSIDATWYPEDKLPREGVFEDYQIKVDPYSMQYTAPQQKLQQIRQSLQTIMPLLPMLQQAGVQFDAQAYLKLESEFQNLPQLLDIFSFTTPPPAGYQQGNQQPPLGNQGGPPSESIRRNVSQGPSSQGRMNQAFTQQPQGSTSNGQGT